LRLAAVAVDPAGGHAVSLKVIRQAIRAVLRARERDDAANLAAPHELHEQRRLELGRDRVGRVGDGRGGAV